METNTTRRSKECREWLRRLFYALLVLGYFVYFGFAVYLNFDKAIPLICFTCFITFCYVYVLTKRRSDCLHILSIREFLNKINNSCCSVLDKPRYTVFLYIISGVCLLSYAIVTNRETPGNLISLLGLFVLILMSVLISYDWRQIKWRPVMWGIGLQMFLGWFILRTTAGRVTFTFLGQEVEIFLSYVDAGATFVFGPRYEEFLFAFKLMPMVIFLNSVISILYYIRVMPVVIEKIALVMHVTLGTTAAETLSTAASIFLGQPEASLMIRPYLDVLTKSELHAIMTAGFASVTADIFGLFVSYGVESSHILTAVLMSAPAGLAVSKIVCPETEESKTKTWKQIQNLDSGLQHQNIVDAASHGAQEAVPIVLSVGATIISCLSLLKFINAVLSYLGDLVNIHNLTFELILSYPLMILSFLMGVPWEDCQIVGEVIGLKTVVNEFVGYQRLGGYILSNSIKKKSEVIATYALCGFSNPTTMGIILGGLGAMIPSRRKILANMIVRAWISGCVACFMTACFAGLLYDENSYRTASNFDVENITMYNTSTAGYITTVTL